MANLPARSLFLKHLVALNRPHLDNFKQWVFQPGMRFNSSEKWWGDLGRRPTPHEGLDLCSFEDLNGTIKTLGRHTRIPAAFAGEVVKIEPDFLGQSIYIRHEISDAGGRQLYSAYGHTLPVDSLAIGAQVAAGELIAVMSDFAGKKSAIQPHLHITFAWVAVPISLADLNWANLGKDSNITLLDPLAVLQPFVP